MSSLKNERFNLNNDELRVTNKILRVRTCNFDKLMRAYDNGCSTTPISLPPLKLFMGRTIRGHLLSANAYAIKSFNLPIAFRI